MSARTLVAGVGNIFLADDGFGVEVARRLSAETPPDGVEIADFGIRGVHLAYQLLEGYDTLILIDAVSRGEPPGTLFVIEPDDGAAAAAPFPGAEPPAAASLGDAHGLDPGSVLAIVHRLGGRPPRLRLVGCEPAEITERIGLSEIVAGSVEPAVRLVRSLLSEAPAPRPGGAVQDGAGTTRRLSCSSAPS